MIPCLYFVVPCYNEEEVLPLTAPVLRNKLCELMAAGLITTDSRIMFVDDGSRDNTHDIIDKLCEDDEFFTGITLSRNYGHQNALLAGLMEAKNLCDITVSVDCDGQDDINAVNRMIDEYNSGAEIVYGVREDRSLDSFFKRSSASAFYNVMRLMGVNSVYNHADFRLVSSVVLNSFADFDEVNLYLRGMFPLVGYQSSCVTYTRGNRIAGKTHYSIGKMLSLALNGITGLSVRPLRLIAVAGLLISLVSFILIIYSLCSYFSGNVVEGWTSTMITVCFIGGVQMLSLGIIGEYIGKIYMEVKHRPKYIITGRTDDRKNRKG